MGGCFAKKPISVSTPKTLQVGSLQESSTGLDGVSRASRRKLLAELPENRVSARTTSVTAQKQCEADLTSLLQELTAATYTSRRPFKVTLFAFLSLLFPVDSRFAVDLANEFPFVTFDSQVDEEFQWIVEVWNRLVSTVEAVAGPITLTNGELPTLSKAVPWQAHEVVRGCFKASKQLANRSVLQTLTQVGRVVSDPELTDQQLVNEIDYAGGFAIFLGH